VSTRRHASGAASGGRSGPRACPAAIWGPTILARLNAGRTGRVKEIRWVPGLLTAPA